MTMIELPAEADVQYTAVPVQVSDDEEQGKRVKLAILEVDGVIANREAEAQEAEAMTGEPVGSEAWWRCFLSAPMVMKAKPVAGAVEALEELRKLGYQIVFLTSRLEGELLKVTRDWLFTNGMTEFEGGDRLIMKPSTMQFVKGGTPKWKASVVAALRNYVFPDEILLVESQPDNISEIIKNVRLAETLLDTGWIKTANALDYALLLAKNEAPPATATAKDEQLEPEDLPF